MTINDKKVEVHIHIDGITQLMDVLNITSSPPYSPIVVSKEEESKKQENWEQEQSLPSGEQDPLWTVHQFAKYFQVSETSARQWIKKGLIPIIRISKRIRIRKSEILKLEKRRGSKTR